MLSYCFFFLKTSPTIIFFFFNEMNNKAFSRVCSNHPTDLDITQRKSQNPNGSDQLVSLCLHLTPPILTLVISDLAPKRPLSPSVPVTWGSLLSLCLCTFIFLLSPRWCCVLFSHLLQVYGQIPPSQ